MHCAVPLHLGGHCVKSGGHDKNFVRRFAPDGYVPHHFHIRSGALASGNINRLANAARTVCTRVTDIRQTNMIAINDGQLEAKLTGCHNATELHG